MASDNIPTPPSDDDQSSDTLACTLVAMQAEIDALRLKFEEARDDLASIETSRNDYAEIVDLSVLPMLTISRDGSIRSANLAAAELLEQERGMLIHRRLDEFVIEADRERLRRYVGSRVVGAYSSCEARLMLSEKGGLPVQIRTRASWRRPQVQHVGIFDLRERELDAWEKQEVKLAAQRANRACRRKKELLTRLGARIASLLEAPTTLGAERAVIDELRSMLASIGYQPPVFEADANEDGLPTDRPGLNRRPSGIVARSALAAGSR